MKTIRGFKTFWWEGRLTNRHFYALIHGEDRIPGLDFQIPKTTSRRLGSPTEGLRRAGAWQLLALRRMWEVCLEQRWE